MWRIFNVYIPDAGPCPDLLASGVGVPPDENKRPAIKNDLFSQFCIDIQHEERNLKQFELNIQESNTMKKQKIHTKKQIFEAF